MTRIGFPHSDIAGSKAICASPTLIAAYHVLHRLPVPRHPPDALTSLTENHSFDQGQMVLMALQPQLLDEVAFPIVKEQCRDLHSGRICRPAVAANQLQKRSGAEPDLFDFMRIWLAGLCLVQVLQVDRGLSHQTV